MQLKFTYVNAKGEKKTRNIIVVHESETKIAGFDLKGLDQKMQYQLRKLYGKKPVTPFPTERAKPGEGHCVEDYWRAYRCFNKKDIQ